MVKIYLRKTRCEHCDLMVLLEPASLCSAASDVEVETVDLCPAGRSYRRSLWHDLVNMEKESRFWDEKVQARV